MFKDKGKEWLHALKIDAVESYLAVMDSLNLQIDKLSEELKQIAPNDDDVRLLQTIPGIGYYAALLIKSEIGTIDSFPDGEHLCSYAGLVTSVSGSGRRVRYGSITKEARDGSGGYWLNVPTSISSTTPRSLGHIIRLLNQKGKEWLTLQ